MARYILVIMFVGVNLYAQETSRDSLDYFISNKQFGTEKQISIRVGGGLQKSFYTETGIAFHKCIYGDTGFFSNDFYTALEWTPNKNQNLYGLKFGYEANTFLLNVGLEVKYQTDFKKTDFVITPKVGLGLFGDVNIFYGYNISTNKNPFSDIIGNHQFSLIFNLNNHFLRYR